MGKSKGMNVLLLENISGRANVLFADDGFEVKSVSNALNEDELIKALIGVNILGIRSKTKITQKVLDESKLIAIGAYCIGLDQIDTNYCERKNVAVFNAPYSSTRSVAELTIANILMLLRRGFEKSYQLQKGIWDKSVTNCFEARGKKLGIVGYGHIGSQVGLFAESLGMQVHFYDIEEKLGLGNAVKCNSLNELLESSDIVTIHVFGKRENEHLMGKDQFNRMKNNSFFINLSRGFVVDTQALIDSVKSEKIIGAALDVYEHEPEGTTNDFKTDLQGLPNVILTPHVGGNTIEAQNAIAEYVTGKVIDFIKSK